MTISSQHRLQDLERAAMDIVELADQVIADGMVSRSPTVLLNEVLSRSGIADGLILPGSNRILSAAEIFDAYVYPGREAVRNYLDQYMEVVALPRSRLRNDTYPGVLMFRRGEDGLAHLAMLVTGKRFTQAEIAMLGVRPESTRYGNYSIVVEAGTRPHRSTDQFARLVSDSTDRLNYDTLIVQIRPDILGSLQPIFSEDSEEANMANQFGAFADLESWNTVAMLESEAAGCTVNQELLELEGELEDSKSWQNTADQIAFRDRVLNAHIARSRSRLGPAQRDLSSGELDLVAGTNIKMESEAAAAASRLLAVASTDLGKAQQAGDVDALRTVKLSATSGYRGSDYQRDLWLRYFARKKGYYNRTQKAREKLADGPHSEQAVAYMLTPVEDGGFGLGGRIAAPGYSNHQNGIAIDLSQVRKKGHEIWNDSDDRERAKWRSTWFHNWLKSNAANFGFQPIPTEEWHWVYRRGPQAATSSSGITSMGSPTEGLPEPLASSRVKPVTPENYLGGKLAEFTGTTPIPAAVFIPKAASLLDKVDVLIYVHGLLERKEKPVCPPPGTNPPVPNRPTDLIKNAPFALGEIVDASSRKIILVVPFIDWKQYNQHPLSYPAKLNRFVDEVLNESGRMQGTSAPSLNSLILAGHSRAFGFLDPLASAHASHEMAREPLSKLAQVWAFDTAYTSPTNAYKAWFDSNPNLVFHVFYRAKKWDPKEEKWVPTETTRGGKAYEKLALELAKKAPGRFNVKDVSEGHCWVPVKQLPNLLAPSIPPPKGKNVEDFNEHEFEEEWIKDNAEQIEQTPTTKSISSSSGAPRQGTMSDAKRAELIAAAIRQATTAGKKADQMAIAATLRANGTDPETWFADIVPDAKFLGRQISPSTGEVPGVHRELFNVLKSVEHSLLRKYPNRTPEQLGDVLGLKSISGLRLPMPASGAEKVSWHCFGLAVDINHDTNPFIGLKKPNREAYKKKYKKDMTEEQYNTFMTNRSPRIIERATWLLHGERFNVETNFKTAGGKSVSESDAGAAWDVHHRASETLAEYLRLADDVNSQRVQTLVGSVQSRGDTETLMWWKNRIVTDRSIICHWDFPSHTNPQQLGYMDLHRELVVVLVGAGLKWGGQFPGAKDMMHFDLR